jgi:hypothetical protein
MQFHKFHKFHNQRCQDWSRCYPNFADSTPVQESFCRKLLIYKGKIVFVGVKDGLNGL